MTIIEIIPDPVTEEPKKEELTEHSELTEHIENEQIIKETTETKEETSPENSSSSSTENQDSKVEAEENVHKNYDLREEIPEIEYINYDETRKTLKERIIDELKEMDAFNEDLNLDTDKFKVAGQEYALISFAGPTITTPEGKICYNDKNCIRILGIFYSIESATNHIKFKLSKEDRLFPTHIVALYKWTQSYTIQGETEAEADKFLNNLVFEHKKYVVAEKIKFEVRKKVLMNNYKKYSEEPIENSPLPNVNIAFKEAEEKEKQKLLEEFNSSKNVSVGPIVENFYETESETESVKPILLSDCKIVIENKKVETTVEDQNYAVISFVGVTGNNNRTAFRIKGAFNKLEEANEHASKCAIDNGLYDYFVCEMYKWIPTDDKIYEIKNVYNNDHLNEIFDRQEKDKVKIKKVYDDQVKFDNDQERMKFEMLQKEKEEN